MNPLIPVMLLHQFMSFGGLKACSEHNDDIHASIQRRISLVVSAVASAEKSVNSIHLDLTNSAAEISRHRPKETQANTKT